MKFLAVTAGVLLFGTSMAFGGEYFVYNDPGGTIVLSNISPPQNVQIVNRYELPEVTDEEIRVAREREQQFWLGLQNERVAQARERLAESNFHLAQAVIASALHRPDPGIIVQVAQTVQRVPRRRR